MTVAALVLAAVAVLVSVITATALIEVYDGLRQVRETVGLIDEAVDVTLAAPMGTPPSAYGLPAHLDDGSAVVLFLSPKCATCYTLGKALRRSLPEGLHVVVTAAAGPAAEAWLADLGVPRRVCTVDDAQEIADRLGLDATPVALIVHDGRLTRATSVPSPRSLDALMQEAAT